MLDKIKANLKAWYSQPYQSDMDVLHWFIFLGLLITLAAGWRIILGHMKQDA